MQQLMHSFRGLEVPSEIIESVRTGQVVSFCLFSYNVASPLQIYELTKSIHSAAEAGGQLTPIIGIDQEGGQLIAITGGATELPGNMALGATRSPELAEKAGEILGRELLALGINMNFAPSLDVNTNPHNPVIGIRSFGEDPQLVAELGAALIRGMQREGVMATAKHFPGHGDTESDSHLAAPVVNHSLERTTAVELHPFREAVHAGSEAIMTAHVFFPALDEEYPATMSRPILTDLLREEMNYQGIIVTDAMDMYAVAQYGHEESVRGALQAGADLIMLGHIPNQLDFHETMADLLDEKAIARIKQTQQNRKTERPSLNVVGCAEHRAIAQEIADKSITVVKGADLPINLDATNQVVAVITPQPVDLTPADSSSSVKIRLAEMMREYHPLVQDIQLPANADADQLQAILDTTAQADLVIVGTIQAEHHPVQAELVKALMQRDQKLVVAALRTPYDITAFPEIKNYVCSYGIREVSLRALVRVIMGEIEATGVLPCSIPGVAV